MTRKLILFCLSVLFSLYAQAATHHRYEKADTYITIEKDATFTEVTDVTLRLLDEEGVKLQGQQAFYYNSQFDKITILAAYTLKPNGQKIPVDLKKGQFDQPLPVAAEAPMYTEARQISLIFPNLAVGDRIVYKVSWHHHTPRFPGAVEVSLYYPRSVVFDKATISLTMPHDFPLFFDIQGLTEKTMRKGATTLTRRWEYRHPVKVEPEQNVANPLTSEPHLFVTSFPNYQVGAQAYEARAADKHSITPEIQALADRLTKGRVGTEARARVIYNWVAQNIRYVAVYFGAGGVVPHPAAEILANRYGDCKDHATLLQTLLKAAGIESSTALIYSGYQYQPQKIASMQAFNHAITYIPALDLFVDSTAEVAPFGILPEAQAQSPSLITRTGELRTTPAAGPKNTHVHYQNTVHYDKEGQAKIKITAKYHGESSLYSRYVTRGETAERLLENLMRDHGLHGNGTMDPGQPTNLDQDQVIKLTLNLEDQLIVPGPAGLTIPSSYGFYTFKWMPNFILMEKDSRKNDFVCTASPLSAEYELTLPDQVEILAIPKNKHIDSNEVRYHATYTQSGQTVSIKRELALTPAQNFCPPSDIKRLKPVMREIMKDLKSQIVYRPRESL
jgi:transglutaminase-like putative cysteine protease